MSQYKDLLFNEVALRVLNKQTLASQTQTLRSPANSTHFSSEEQ